MKDPLRITLLQTDIVWEDKSANLCRLRRHLEGFCGQTDMVILPETFSTGFSMHPEALAEPLQGEVITLAKQWSARYRVALAGSFIACNDTCNAQYTNRAFFLTPEGDEWYYDKRHLFRMGGEDRLFTPGTSRPIIHYKGWNILLLVCYDLRFPVWSRNVGNEYDLLIYVANWPTARRKVWDVLLQARALENASYVCGVNRIGTDGNRIVHNGGSRVYSYKGDMLAFVPDGQEGHSTTSISLTDLRNFRTKFPVWKDADHFEWGDFP